MSRIDSAIILLLLAALACSGCEPRTRYKTLSFFFDGVPDPDKIAAPAVGEKKNSNANAANTNEKRLAQYSEHGPYAAKLCEGCHVRGSNKLVLPLEDLCKKCHAISADKRLVHGPLASGGCRVCHNPHSSPYRSLLVSESREFCYFCHQKGDVLKKDVHKEMDRSCTSCHDAHMSDNDYLLK